jgi:predicted amidohydrolase YtcJ
MMKRSPFFLIALLLLASLVTAQIPTPERILVNGKVWTGESSKPYVSAVAIRGERIIAVGTDEEIRRLAGSATETIDLGGAFAMPGVNDSHIHFLGSSLTAFQVDLSEAKTLAEAQQLIKQFAVANPDAPWITGFGWLYGIFPENRLPLREDIDAVVSDRPVYLRAYDGHTAWANSKAFEIAGVNEKTEFTGWGELVRDSAGRPSGTLKESAMGLVSRHVPPVTRELELEALRRGFNTAHALGITSIQNAHGSLREAELYEELLNKGELRLRTSFAFSVGPNTGQEDIDRIVQASKRFNSSMLKVGAVKIAIDGVIESYTAAMLEPYTNNPETSGTPTFTQERLNEVVAMVDKAGLQIYIHAIGDRGIRMALDAFENAKKVNGRQDSRFRIEHIETINANDIVRFKELGVIASMEPIHADPGTVSVWSENIGTERTSRAFAWQLLQNAGATLIFSSDFPAAISMSPWRGLHNAVNRRTIDGFPTEGWLAQHRVTVDTALKAYTVNGAFASFEENVKGKIAPGMFADIIVLDRNPFEIPPMELHKIKVVGTIFNGR